MVYINIETNPNKNSTIEKILTLKNSGKRIAWNRIKTMNKFLIEQGDYENKDIYIRAYTKLGWRTIKSLDEELEESMEDYFVNKVRDPREFSKDITEVSITILK